MLTSSPNTELIDLTHPIASNMPVYPGTEPPVLITGCTIDESGFLEKKITLYSHTGTHVDAPAHLIKGAKTLDRLPIMNDSDNTGEQTVSYIDDIKVFRMTPAP